MQYNLSFVTVDLSFVKCLVLLLHLLSIVVAGNKEFDCWFGSEDFYSRTWKTIDH